MQQININVLILIKQILLTQLRIAVTNKSYAREN